MKLLVISGAFPPLACGEATNTYFLCRHLVDRGVDVHLLTTSQKSMPNIPGINIRALMKHWSWIEIRVLLRVLRTVRPDAVLLIYFDGIYNCHPMISFVSTLTKKVMPDIRFVTRFENVLSGCGSNYLPSLSIRGFRRLMVSLVGKKGTDYRLGTLLRDSDSLISLCGYHTQLLKKVSAEAQEKTVLIPPSPNILVLDDPTGVHREHGRSLNRKSVV